MVKYLLHSVLSTIETFPDILRVLRPVGLVISISDNESEWGKNVQLLNIIEGPYFIAEITPVHSEP